MRDYQYAHNGELKCTISQLPTEEIQRLLQEGFVVQDGLTPEAAIERLRLELLIRELGL